MALARRFVKSGKIVWPWEKLGMSEAKGLFW